MNEYLPLAKIAEMYNVTTPTIHYWIKKGLPYKMERIIGVRPRKVVTEEDVKNYLKIGISDPE